MTQMSGLTRLIWQEASGAIILTLFLDLTWRHFDNGKKTIPEESKATNLNRVKKHHMSKHFRRIATTSNVENWCKLVVGFKSFVSSMCIDFSPENSKGLVPMNPASPVVKWWYWWTWVVWMSTVNMQNLNLLTHQLPASYFWMNVSFLKGGGLNIISCWTFLYNV